VRANIDVHLRDADAIEAEVVTSKDLGRYIRVRLIGAEYGDGVNIFPDVEAAARLRRALAEALDILDSPAPHGRCSHCTDTCDRCQREAEEAGL
jgi:hypothetical protein